MITRSTLSQLIVAVLFVSLATCTASAKESAVKPAPNMPSPTFVETNGIRMAVYVQGEGVPVVLCHGFPELAYSWRNQVGPLSKAGFRVIVPDQRGYGLTDRPDDAKTYDMKHLCDDLAGMLDALKIEKAIFCGHDWGGAVVWSMVRLHPDRCLGVIGVNTPCSRPPGMPRVKPSEKSLINMTSDYYVNQFQKPGHAEAVLEKDVRKTFKHILTRGDIWNVDVFQDLPEDSPERKMDLLTMVKRDKFLGQQFLSDTELNYFVDTFQKTGFTGGLNWYRNIMRMGPSMKDAKWKIDVPCLYIGAENDVILRPSSADGMGDFIKDFERHTVKDCGHWTQQEKPEEFNRVVLDWLKRKTK